MKKHSQILLGIISVLCLAGFSTVMVNNPFRIKHFEKVTSSVEQFHYQPEKIEVGTVYNFTVSNRDQSYAKEVSLYVASKNRIESFKIYPGVDGTVVVIAEMDWDKFSIGSIYQLEIARDLSRNRSLGLNLVGNDYVFDVKEDNPYGIKPTTILNGHFPSFNHGYDFADLNFIFRHLKNPKSDVDVGIVSPTPETFAYTGNMKISYEGEAPCHDTECYQYSLSGRGIANQMGTLLVNKEKGHFEYMEVGANYHPAFDIFRYELSSITKMTPQEWKAHMNAKSVEYFEKNPAK